MVELYSGTPGSGKSLHLAQLIYDTLKYTDKLVITNFRLKDKKINKGKYRGKLIMLDNEMLDDTPFLYYLSNWYFTTHKYREGKILLIIDEAQRLFNPRDWNKPTRREWLTFIAEHRHWGFDVILVAQFDGMLDKQILAEVENEYIHRKLSNFGIYGKFLTFVLGGSGFCVVKIWRPIKEKMGSSFFRYRRKYAGLYDSWQREY